MTKRKPKAQGEALMKDKSEKPDAASKQSLKQPIKLPKAPKMTKEVREYFKQISKLGGAIGGRARALKLSPERRSEIAAQAAAARIAKYGQTPSAPKPEAVKKDKPKAKPAPKQKKQKLKKAA
jgi:hypothetical protein